MNEPDLKLPALIDRARQSLAEARTSAEVLEARAAAQAAYHYAKVVKAANSTKADCLAMIARAELRMADEIDAAQERGEIARADVHGRGIQSSVQTPDTRPVTLAELGLSRQRVAEWRRLRDAGGEPLVENVIQGALAQNQAPTMSGIHQEARNVIFVRRSEPDPSEETPCRTITTDIKFVTPEMLEQDKIWRRVQVILNTASNPPNPIKAAAAVPEDKKAWITHQVARQITWLEQFIDALIGGRPDAPPGDHAPIEEDADQRRH